MSKISLEKPLTLPGPVVLFDGECVFCDWAVRFILQRERDRVLYFAPLQSDVGAALLAEIPEDSIPDSVVFHDGSTVFFKSDAALCILPRLKSPWSWLRVTGILPAPIRDWLYGIVARFRYRIFGRKESCTIPTALERDRELTELPEG